MAFRYFNGCQEDAQIWISDRPRPWSVEHGNASLIELPNNKEGFSLGYNPFDEELFQTSRGKKKEVHWPRDVYSLDHGHFSSSSRGYQIRSGTGIMRGGIRASFSHPFLP